MSVTAEYKYKKVMVVDDAEIDIYIAGRTITQSRFAEEMIGMESAREALSYLATHQNAPDKLPELIFLDINMPVMNGFAFLEEYAQLPQTIHGHCKIYMLTTSAHPDDQDKAVSNVFVKGLLTKPMTVELLGTL